jgi:CheY-like chemotaxis protein
MSTSSRILLVEGTPAEWRLALSSLSQNGMLEQTTVVKDQEEALDFLHARGTFRRRPSGLPAVVVLGPNLQKTSAFSLLQDIRADETLRRLPVVMIAEEADAESIRSAYEGGVNSLIRKHEDKSVQGERYAALALFWGWANEPPPGCLVQPKSQRRAP